MTDIDMVGQLCDACFDRMSPPHYDYLRNLLPKKARIPSVIKHIAQFAYPVCAESG